MRILLFSDIHGDTKALEELVATPADLYISCGDLSTFGRGLERCGEALRPLGERLLVIPGNHETAADNRAFCEKFGFVDFHLATRTLAGKSGATHWAGIGYSNITPFNTPGEFTDAQIADHLRVFEGKSPLYLAAHVPPHGTALDRTGSGKHAGSAAMREWIQRVQPAAMFCGHIHECAGTSESLGATPCRNLGKAGFLLEI